MYAFSILEIQLLWGFSKRNEKYLRQAIEIF